MRRVCRYGTVQSFTPRGSMVRRFCAASKLTFAPSSCRISRSTCTSSMSGMFSMTQGSSQIRAAGMTATEVFFPPETSTSPFSGCPPVINSL